jgi:hypothetical protein
MSSAAGVQPCAPCEQRAASLNQRFPLRRRPRIFVSIAAYRDPELVPTVFDCLAKAQAPESLRFGVCWQHGPDEKKLPFARDSRFRILDVDWRDSQGACWARAETMRLFDGEEYYLQCDSHHRFVQNWDAALLDLYDRTPAPRPILSSYCPAYSPGHRVDRGATPYRLEFDGFASNGLVPLKAGLVTKHGPGTPPERARFLSAHFLFAKGTFVEDVPYDPELYFFGEEITLAVRAYTCGYDLFHPRELMLFHGYARQDRSLHWGDHVNENGVATEWWERDAHGQSKAATFLQEPYTGRYGCGEARSFSQYEEYAGISFAGRQAQDYTRRQLEPPNPPAPSDWVARTRTRSVRIELRDGTLANSAPADWSFWYLAIHDQEDQELCRQDVIGDELRVLLPSNNGCIVVERNFMATAEPVAWRVWPVTSSGDWLEPFVGQVSEP